MCTAIMEPATTHRAMAPHLTDLLILWVTVDNSTCLTGVAVIAGRVSFLLFLLVLSFLIDVF